MRKEIRYKITEKDLKKLSKFPLLPVLQPRYIGDNTRYTVAVEAFKEFLIDILEKWKSEELTDIEEVNYIIYKAVEAIKVTYPRDFDEGMGWYSKKMLVELWEKGEIDWKTKKEEEN